MAENRRYALAISCMLFLLLSTLTMVGCGGGGSSEGGTVTNNDETTIDTSVLGEIVRTPVVGLCSEAGGKATFYFRLSRQPASEVVVLLSVSDTTEATVTPSFVNFTPLDYGTFRFVEVTGVDDEAMDMDKNFTLTLRVGYSADEGYANMAPVNISMTNLDDDAVEINHSYTGPGDETFHIPPFAEGGSIDYFLDLGGNSCDVFAVFTNSTASETETWPAIQSAMATPKNFVGEKRTLGLDIVEAATAFGFRGREDVESFNAAQAPVVIDERLKSIAPPTKSVEPIPNVSDAKDFIIDLEGTVVSARARSVTTDGGVTVSIWVADDCGSKPGPETKPIVSPKRWSTCWPRII